MDKYLWNCLITSVYVCFMLQQVYKSPVLFAPSDGLMPPDSCHVIFRSSKSCKWTFLQHIPLRFDHNEIWRFGGQANSWNSLLCSSNLSWTLLSAIWIKMRLTKKVTNHKKVFLPCNMYLYMSKPHYYEWLASRFFLTENWTKLSQFSLAFFPLCILGWCVSAVHTPDVCKPVCVD